MDRDAWFEDLDARHAPPELRPPVRLDEPPPARPALELVPVADADSAAWDRLRAIWLAMPPHPSVLAPLARTREGLLLRYAALRFRDAGAPPPGASPHASRTLGWGAQLAHAFAHVAAHVPDDHLGRFGRPRAFVDAGGHARLVFLPHIGAAASSPAALVAIAARAWEELVAASGRADDEPVRVAELIAGCTSGDAARRPRTPLALWRRVDQVARHAVRPPSAPAWEHVEAGLGWLATGDAERAREAFEAAMRTGKELELAVLGRERAYARLGLDVPPWEPDVADSARRAELARAVESARVRVQPEPPPPPAGGTPWPAASVLGRAREAARAWDDAIAIYQAAVPCVDAHVALARCHLARGEHGHAIDRAGRALEEAPDRAEARSCRARARLVRGEASAALVDADELVARDPRDALGHHLRGLALLRLGRTDDAIAALDRAVSTARDEELRTAAVVLRGRAARMAGVARVQAGEHVEPPPGSLPETGAGTEADGDLARLDAVLAASDAHLAALRLRALGG